MSEENKIRIYPGDTVFWFEVKSSGITMHEDMVTGIEYSCIGYFVQNRDFKVTTRNGDKIWEKNCFLSKQAACDSMIKRLQEYKMQT